MPKLNASEILRGAWALLDGSDITTIESEDFALFRGSLHRHLKLAWEDLAWPQLVKVEKRYFREGWDSATGYSAGAQVYHFDSGKYAQALRASTNEAPFDASEVENSAYWAELKESYDGNEDYSGTTAYAAGDIVYYPANDTFYQCHSASTGNLPTDTSFWGALAEFDRTISFTQPNQTEIGYPLGAYAKHPDRVRNAQEHDYTLGDDEVILLDDVSSTWLRFLEPAPKVTGASYESTTAYAVGDQVYYAGTSGGEGTFYNCTTTTSAGEDPVGTPAKWESVNIPEIFELYLTYACARELHQKLGRPDLPTHIQADPMYHLENQKLKLQGQGLFRRQRRRK